MRQRPDALLKDFRFIVLVSLFLNPKILHVSKILQNKLSFVGDGYWILSGVSFKGQLYFYMTESPYNLLKK